MTYAEQKPRIRCIHSLQSDNLFHAYTRPSILLDKQHRHCNDERLSTKRKGMEKYIRSCLPLFVTCCMEVKQHVFYSSFTSPSSIKPVKMLQMI